MISPVHLRYLLILAANPMTVVVQMSADPLTVPWLKENIPAMLQAWWPGEEGGHAFVVEPGDYETLIGSSSADIRAQGSLMVVK
jgi:hypothetical protein